jgi:hypothetical protein
MLSDPATPFVQALRKLRQALDKPDPVTVDIIEPDWQPRPFAADLPTSLQEAVVLGRNLVEFNGLMALDELQLAKQGCANADSRMMELLYQDALTSGFAGAAAKVQAYRGSAKSKTKPILPVVQ